MPWSRRDFLAAGIASSLALGLEPGDADEAHAQAARGPLKRPIIVCANNGLNYLDDAYAFLANGGDTLDAALRVVKGPEDDPEDDTVGMGGLPNEEGVVELDACCMHGPTRRAGAVGGLRNVRNASLAAKAVMAHTGHVMLVGEGAERFAVASGLARENLLTERSRKVWFLWRQYHSTSDWWGPGPADPRFQAPDAGAPAPKPRGDVGPEHLRRLERLAADVGIEPAFRRAAIARVLSPPTGTIHCSALSAKGEISGCTTTSGLAFKLPGRLGDSPIIGAGCYTDPDVGSAGATGSGEENIKVAGAHTIVENMRRGMAPVDAGMDALKRIAHNYRGDQSRLRFVDMKYYILRTDGAYAGVSLWEAYGPDRPHKIAVHDGTKRSELTVSLFKGASRAYPPFPKLPPDEARP